eukprot:TRINITY_DN30171_c0_g1_i1.p1 TRINITY_DN30171_c0_g1~~TRINITY_DN30171_c0_g1_i1.p1  ORF type:complete len:772 (+),score=94.21 TRINITY_DN30171_c0_g1_i1:80-2395(+)
MDFKVGDEVEVHSLTSGKYNGMHGEVIRRNFEFGRWQVILKKCKVLKEFREANLRHILPRVGDYVRIMTPTNYSGLNGKLGKVIEGCPGYHVMVSNKVLVLKAQNLRKQNANEPRLGDDAWSLLQLENLGDLQMYSLSQSELADSSGGGGLEVGCQVQISGLTSPTGQGFNGLVGTIIRRIPDQLWRTIDIAGQTHIIKTEHLCRQALDSGVSADSLCSPEDKRHVSAIEAEYYFMDYLESVENRSITLSELEHMQRFVAVHCCKWFDRAEFGTSKTAGQSLSMSFLNLYHLTDWLIRPATKTDRCAFVELLTKLPRPPTWMITHWWGEPVSDFIACIDCHAKERCLQDDISYWICAYSIGQNYLALELSHPDPRRSPFYMAMCVAKEQGGGLLLVLDESGPATPFARIWCCFELATNIEHLNMKMDVACVVAGKEGGVARLLTEGLATCDEVLGEKIKRERKFPLRVLRPGLETQVETAMASLTEDKKRIVNCLVGNELNADPPQSHSKLEKMNTRLRATFALAAWPQADTRGEVQHYGLPELLKADTWRESVVFEFDDRSQNISVETLASSLPPKLRILHVSFPANLSPASFVFVTKRLPESLRELQLNVGTTAYQTYGASARCVDDLALQALAGCDLPNLENFQLQLISQKLVTDVGICALVRLFTPNLSALTTRLNKCKQISDASVAALAEGLPHSIKTLFLDFSGTGVRKWAARQRDLKSLRLVAQQPGSPDSKRPASSASSDYSPHAWQPGSPDSKRTASSASSP